MKRTLRKEGSFLLCIILELHIRKITEILMSATRKTAAACSGLLAKTDIITKAWNSTNSLQDQQESHAPS